MVGGLRRAMMSGGQQHSQHSMQRRVSDGGTVRVTFVGCFPICTPHQPVTPASLIASTGEAAKKVSRLALEKIRKMQLDGEDRSKEFNERIADAEREQSEMQVGGKGRNGRGKAEEHPGRSAFLGGGMRQFDCGDTRYAAILAVSNMSRTCLGSCQSGLPLVQATVATLQQSLDAKTAELAAVQSHLGLAAAQAESSQKVLQAKVRHAWCSLCSCFLVSPGMGMASPYLSIEFAMHAFAPCCRCLSWRRAWPLPWLPKRRQQPWPLRWRCACSS